jgi:hypothetical protein
MKPRITPKQRHILERIADGWFLTSDGVETCWIQSSRGPVYTTEDVPTHTAERLVLRKLVHSCGYLLPDGWAAIGRELRRPALIGDGRAGA